MSSPVHAAITAVFNGASYQAGVSPDSWAVAFGSALARTTAIASVTADGQWPTTLGGTTVTVDGKPAELYYVSAGQINFLIPDGTTFGSLAVVITDVASGATQSGTVQVQNTAAGLFSSDSSGTGPGAILNGVTYAPAPFLVQTPENGGTDLRTRLAVYCTGLRFAGNPSHDSTVTNVASSVTARGRDTAGNQYTFTVEYAGVAPGYIGLDQVNIVLPAELDGAGVVSLTITADNLTSNVVTFQVNALPASSLQVTGLTLTSSEVAGGTSVGGTVSISGLAKSGGFSVSLRSSVPSVVLPGAVVIPQGQAGTTFTITTPTVTGVQTTTITASGNGASATATLQIDPSTLAQLSNFTATPSTIQGGTNLAGTVTLTAAPPLGGVSVQLSSDNAAVQVPASVTVPFNSTSTNFSIPTSTVTTSQTANLSATLNSTTLNAEVVVVPALQITLPNTSVTGGTSLTATVTLGTAAPTAGATITLTSSASAFASVPNFVTIAAGQTSATFTVTTFTVTDARTVTITAAYLPGQLSQSTTLTVTPPPAGTLQSVAVNPGQVTGGSNATGTVTLAGGAPAGGLVVQLKTSNVFTAQAPSFITVTQGQTTATFTVTTSKVTSSQTITITATAGGIAQTTTLTVN